MSDDFQQRGGSPWGSPPGGGGSGNGSGRGPLPEPLPLPPPPGGEPQGLPPLC